MLVQRVYRERHRGIGGGRQAVRFAANRDDVGSVASSGAFGVVCVNGASLESADGILHEAGFVDGVGVNRYLHVVLFGRGERGINRGRSSSPIFMQLESDRAGLDLLAQRLAGGAVAFAQKSEVDGKSV